MKVLVLVFLSLSSIQSANAIKNSQCLIEYADNGFDPILLGLGYFPVTTSHANLNGYHPGLMLVADGNSPARCAIQDQTGVVLASQWVNNKTWYDCAVSLPKCSELPR